MKKKIEWNIVIEMMIIVVQQSKQTTEKHFRIETKRKNGRKK